MLVDHVRETFFLHHPIGDPVDYQATPLGLYLTRMLTEPCAPVFIFLTGLSAYLFSQTHSLGDTSRFLLKRGLFLILLEFTLVDLAWSGEFPPQTLNLQVIWCIGVCMIVLAGLLKLPRTVLLLLAILIIAGHNLLDGITFATHDPRYLPWAILHRRAYIEFEHFPDIITSYPVLPWIGVILLGYVTGPLYAATFDPHKRLVTLCGSAALLFIAFIVIRGLNIYGEQPWQATGDPILTFMSFKSATKYPPSLMFLMPSLALALALLALAEVKRGAQITRLLATYGAAPMFFYLLHLYALKGLYITAVQTSGLPQGTYYGFEELSSIWLCSAALAIALFYPTRWFARLKQHRRDIAWLKYF
ncbi:hypothetical protein D9M70_474340 [compost metagenome]